jgi:electron transfer flavoprotein alpha subunit
MTDHKGVMIFCEVAEGKLAAITAELLGCGRKLADDLGQELCAVLVGCDVSPLAQEAITFGAEKAYVVDDPLLKDYQTDSYLKVMERLLKKVMPQILILGQTSIGRDLAPTMAFRLKTTATLDCVDLSIDIESKRLWQTKPVYGGNAQATFTGDADPQIVTIRVKAMAPLERDSSRQGKIIAFEAGLDASNIRTRVLERVPEEIAGVKLEGAEVVVTGGRGIGDAEGFKQLEELAKMLKGAVGATRPACDSGWVHAGLQVGLTGKIVAPDLYIAVALSGASQHISGCYGSKNIVAINNDPDASIFKEARFGVVGDWKKVLPAFVNKVKKLLME